VTFPSLKRPIVFYDLESTGLFIDVDRIIELALLKIFPDGKTFRWKQRFNPGMKIPVESIAIHGIHDEDLAEEPRFTEHAQKLFEIFSDADLAGYAIRRLDIPLLAKEFERSGYIFSKEGRQIIDAKAIFTQKEPRSLAAAYQFYCGKELVGAHGAEADNEATYQVFLAQLKRYTDLPKDMEGLHAFCSPVDPSHVDQDGKLIWRDGDAFFNFGKHRYRSLQEVSDTDVDYLDWIIRKADFSKELVEICVQAKNGIFPHKQLKTSP